MTPEVNDNSKQWYRHELSYCSNVHPSETLESLDSVVTLFIKGVMTRRGLNAMAAGLWLSKQIIDQFSSKQKRDNFKALLSQNGIKLITLNGFPYGDFHAESVKEQVYMPDWSRMERFSYTQKLAEILADCLPKDAQEGTISSLPLGYRHTWTEEKHETATQALCKLAVFLSELYLSTGRSIRLCLEMEPDCVLEKTDELIHFFCHDLPKQAKLLGIDKTVIDKHLGICFDVCHQAVMFEDIEQSLTRIVSANITIGKIQISNALEIKHPDDNNAIQALGQFVEPRYLHQSRTLQNENLIGDIDLPLALESMPRLNPWRIHFHLPIQTTTLNNKALSTTQDAILKVLDFLKNTPKCKPHLEIETYTWHVLPPALRPQDNESLITGLTEEINWLEKQMLKRELLTQ